MTPGLNGAIKLGPPGAIINVLINAHLFRIAVNFISTTDQRKIDAMNSEVWTLLRAAGLPNPAPDSEPLAIGERDDLDQQIIGLVNMLNAANIPSGIKAPVISSVAPSVTPESAAR
jgi:hypothetical protein